MDKHVKVTLEAPQGTGRTTLAALLTWALRKFNYTLDYKGADRAKWMQLSGDEMELSQRVADMFKKGNFPSVEVHETVAQTQPVIAQVPPTILDQKDAEIASLKAEVVDLTQRLKDAGIDSL